MKRIPAWLALCPALLLSSCYTNINQAWFNKQYTGYQLDYYTDEPAGMRGLPPQLYRCGESWYIAAICSEVRDRDYHLHLASEGFHKRHAFALTPQAGRPVRYHKITPEMAGWMLRSDHESPDWFTHDKVIRELTKAGGGWLEQLPPGAVPVKAEFLKYCRARANYVEESPAEPEPWYAYPLAGLTFLCVDVPCSAVATVVPVVPLVGLLCIYSMQDDSADAISSHSSATPASFKRESVRMDDIHPLLKTPYDDYEFSSFPATFDMQKVREPDDDRPLFRNPYDDDYYYPIDKQRPTNSKPHHTAGSHLHPGNNKPQHHGSHHHTGGNHLHTGSKPHHSTGSHHSHTTGDKPHHSGSHHSHSSDKPQHHDKPKRHDSDSDKENTSPRRNHRS